MRSIGQLMRAVALFLFSRWRACSGALPRPTNRKEVSKLNSSLGCPMDRSSVLDEHYDPSYNPSQKEIYEYASFLGMDLERDKVIFELPCPQSSPILMSRNRPCFAKALLWIAREGLKAPLPDKWKPCKTGKGDIYYFNFETGEVRE
jgi:hypothetical protein